MLLLMLYLLQYFLLAKIKPTNALNVADLPCNFFLEHFWPNKLNDAVFHAQ